MVYDITFPMLRREWNTYKKYDKQRFALFYDLTKTTANDSYHKFDIDNKMKYIHVHSHQMRNW